MAHTEHIDVLITTRKPTSIYNKPFQRTKKYGFNPMLPKLSLICTFKYGFSPILHHGTNTIYKKMENGQKLFLVENSEILIFKRIFVLEGK